MASKKSPKSPHSKAISADAHFWFKQFQRHFELVFVEQCEQLSDDSDIDGIRQAGIRAVVETMLESGIDSDRIIAEIGTQLQANEAQSSLWNAELNNRRIALIDKDLLSEATLEDHMELARLTAAMRRAVDNEQNLPVGEARQLLKKLRMLDSPE